MRWHSLYADALDAWADVASRPFRSTLSAIGICVGVLAVVAMLSITGGARQEALAGAVSLGLDKIRVEQKLDLPRHSIPLSAADAQALALSAGVDITTTFYAREAALPMHANGHSVQGDHLVVPGTFFGVERLAFTHGAPWRQTAQLGDCVSGASLASQLGATVGSTIVVGNTPCRLVGVLAPRTRLLTEGTGLSAIDFNQSLFTPWHAASPQSLTGLIVQVAPDERFDVAVRAVDDALAAAHSDNLLLVVPRALAAQVDENQRLFTLIMAAIASLALFVGGVGVANSLLATVAEQTREIGLRIAVGAPPNRVLSLYILHALWICGIGALSGALLGLLAAVIAQWLAAWPAYISLSAVVVGIGFAVITAILSAAYPAQRAARMTAAGALIDY